MTSLAHLGQLARNRELISEIKLSRLEDYLHIGGDRLPAWKAAERLGVTTRTVERYRQELRQRGLAL